MVLSGWLRRNNHRGAIGTVLAIILICLVHVATFRRHYAGAMIYPWDFFSPGYQSQAVAWFEDGGIFHPATFFPYSSMGFPAWWSVQAGGWYLPLQFMSWLGFKFTFVFSAIFQTVHVLVGALAMLALARICGASLLASLIAALAYHFSSLFFANAEHADFVRAAALAPLLLTLLHPKALGRHAAMVAIAALCVQQFLIAAYPGDIVSGFYMIAFFCLIWLASLGDRRAMRDYALRLLLAGASGVLMSMVKWLTPMMAGFETFVPKATVFPIRPSHWLTLLFRYGVDALPGDLTEQSLWLPPVALLLIIFIRRRSGLLAAAIVLAALAGLAGSLEVIAPGMRKIVPGLSISRLANSDWRLPLHIASALASASIFDLLRKDQGVGLTGVLVRIGAIVVLLAAASAIALRVGYSRADILPEIVLALIFVAAAGLVLLWRWKSDLTAATALAAICIAYILTASYLQYFVEEPETWRTAWTKQDERAAFGKTIAALISRPRIVAWPRRPARLTYGVPDTKDPGQRLDLKFDRAYYAQEFTAFGYDDIGGPEYKQFEALYEDPKVGDDLLAFVNHPGQAIAIAPGAAFDFHAAANCPAQQIVCVQGPASVAASMLRYDMDGPSYDLTVDRDVDLIENEPFYPDFRARLCEANNCSVLKPDAVAGDLRSWRIPKGHWTMRVYYVRPYWSASVALTLTGIGLALSLWVLTAIGSLRAGRAARRRQESDRARLA